jgi:4-hydroxybenzoyl-CoA reductase subunit beta
MLRLHEYSYHRPRAVEEALALLAQEDALPISGGTDLMPNMKHGLFTPRMLVSLGGISDLRGIALRGEAGEARLSIGATETLASIAAHPLVTRHFPALASAAGQVAGPQIRNRGTIGGNLCLDTRCTYYNQTRFWRSALGFCLKKDGDVCHVTRVGRRCVAANSADTPPVLTVLGAEVELASPGGTRIVPVRDFFVADGIWNTVRQPGEIVTRVHIPLPPAGARSIYRKVRQRASIDFPLLSLAVGAVLAEDGTVDRMEVVVSALGARPRIVHGVEKAASGRRLEDAADVVAGLAHTQCHPLENLIVDPEWRRAMVPVYVRRAIREMASAGSAGVGDASQPNA